MNEERKETDVSQRDDLNKHAKTGKAVKAVASVTLAGCLVASLGLNIYQARQSSSQNRKVNKFIDNQLERQAKEEEQENTYLSGYSARAVIHGDWMEWSITELEIPISRLS